MASRPKIVIGPKKKKKKPLIVLPQKAGADGPSAPSAGRPASPNTVAVAAGVAAGAAVGSTAGGVGGAGAGGNGGTDGEAAKPSSNKQGKRSKSGISIKPFARPPSLPPNFYDASLAVLRRATTCVLRHEALTASSSGGGSGNNSQHSRHGQRGADPDGDPMAVDAPGPQGEGGRSPGRLIGREELYRSVEDLCVHKFGVRLYSDLVSMMEGAAGEVVGRLCQPEKEGAPAADDDEMLAVASPDGGVGYDAARLVAELHLKDGGCTYDPSGTQGSGAERAAGNPSDRRHALLKRLHAVCRAAYAEEYLTFVRSIFLALDRAYVYLADVALEGVGLDDATKDGKPPGGKVLERAAAGGAGGNNPQVWGLWEVGLACLRGHMLRSSPIDEMTDAATTTVPVLTALVLTTAHALLSECDGAAAPSLSYSSDALAMGDRRSLLRNCVRTCVDLGALPHLLEEIIVAASARFAHEGTWWAAALRDSRRSAPEYLMHVELRLKQSAALAGHYLPSNAASAAALRGLAQQGNLAGSGPSTSPPMEVVWSPADSATRRILPAIIEKQLLGPHLGGILEPRHLHPLLDDDDGSGAGGAAWKTTHSSGAKTHEHAKRLYGLCWRMAASAPRCASEGPASSPAPPTALDQLRRAFGEYGRLRGAEIVRQGLASNHPGTNGKELERKVVPDLLAFKSHLYSLLAGAFRSDESFGRAVRSILEEVLNGAAPAGNNDADGDGGRRIAELLAKQVDARFKDAKAQADETFQGEILALFRHVHAKDVFEAFYRRDLAKRLLTGRAVSTDAEKSFVAKLKAECGPGYTSKMEGMFKDVDLGRDIMGGYAAHCAGRAAASEDANGPAGRAVDVDVRVLTTGYWPVYPQYPNIILPPEMRMQREKFERYYDDKYQGRHIAWQYSLGNCIVRASFPRAAAPKELVVNVCQSLVLLCFRNDDGPDGRGLTLDEIAKKTGIDDRGELERVLQSLSMGREGTRVLRKVDYDSPTDKATSSPSEGGSGDSPKKKKRLRRTIGPFDRLLFNAAFASNQRRIRITNITMKETAEERTQTHAAVSKDRLYLIDAAVVRIMKARKTIGHRDLIGEVLSQLKFPSTSADVKKRVESLIEREYMERVEGDRSSYKYLA
ncbi:hypothetical protein ACHAXT_007333 [Thalassiosira profunda]